MKKVISLIIGALILTASAYAEDFLDLVKTGTADQVRAALQAGANVEQRDTLGLGRTPLMNAAEKNSHADVISVLLGAGAKLEDQDYLDMTPLLFAALSNPNPEVISVLVQAGANLEARESLSGKTALICAYRDNKVMSVLLGAGAKIDAQDEADMTALMWAAQENENPEVITTLLNAGANGKLKSEEGKTAFDYANENKALKGTKQLQDLYSAQF